MADKATQPDAIDGILADWARERPDLDASSIDVLGRLMRLGNQVRAAESSYFDEYGLTLASFDVLANLRRSGPPHRKTAGELATSSMLTTGGITFRLDRMEEQNLIERVRTREDRRVVYAQLTAHGKAVIDEAFGKHLEQQRRLLSGLTPSELDQLAMLLKKAEASVLAFDSGVMEMVGQESDTSPV
jgi:DNA-binding MarR family transcriptional regulator